MRISDAGEASAPHLSLTDSPDRRILRLSGKIGFRGGRGFWREIHAQARSAPAAVCFDLAEVESIDGGGAALLSNLLDELQVAGVEASLENPGEQVRSLLEIYRSDPREGGAIQPLPRRLGFFDQIGSAAQTLIDLNRALLDFLGSTIAACFAALRRPASVNWRDLGVLMERAGSDAVPIIIVVNVLIGMILAFQGAIQLKQFGADIFVADLVGIAHVRELGPLMTAILVAGRSGAGFAAELGTMKVAEEIDALQTLGQCPYRFLVLPRILALVCMVPLLTVIGDLVGILGGFGVAMIALDITPIGYLNETRQAVGLWDVSSGLLKSVFFGLLVALIACQRGLATRGGAQGVGRSTTSSVVTIIFSLIALDTLFTVVFNLYGL